MSGFFDELDPMDGQQEQPLLIPDAGPIAAETPAPVDPKQKAGPKNVSVITKRNKSLFPFVMITWALGLVTGQDQCEWRPWFRSRYKYPEVPDPTFDAAAWSAQHQDQVQRRVRELEADGWKVETEGKNWMRLKGETAILVGKPDIVASRGAQYLVVDEKTGKQSEKDWWQVLLYMYLMLKLWNPNLRVTGQVEYADGTRVDVHPDEFTPELRAKFFAVVKRIGDPTEPAKTPTANECRFCNISNCDKRITATPEEELPKLTDEF